MIPYSFSPAHDDRRLCRRRRSYKVMASNVHMFLADPVATLGRWLDITRPGGWVAITHQPRKQAATGADTAHGADRIAADLRAAGFTDVRVATLEMKPVHAARVLGRRPA